MTNADIASRLIALGADVVLTRLTLSLLADEKGVVHVEGEELAKLFGVSRQTLTKRLKGIARDEVGNLVVTPVAVDAANSLYSVFYNEHSIISKDVKNTREKSREPHSELIEHWRDIVAERYGAKPKIAYYIVNNAAKAFIRKYGYANATQIVDFVVENYDTLWRSSQYPQPTIGATIGWIGEQAWQHVKARQAEETARRITIEPEDNEEVW